MSSVRLKALPWLMWSLPLAFFAYQFILRLWPSLLMQQIMEQFSIEATAFGFLSAMYYFGYASMQIPVAILLDRYGAKLIIALCAILCGLSIFLFTFTNQWGLALLGRFLIGAASAVGFLGVSKAVSLWFPLNRYSTMIGLTFTFGLLGALYGGKPVNYMIDTLGWQKVASIIALFGIALGCFIFIFFKNPPTAKIHKNKITLKDLQKTLKSPALIWLAVANLLMVGSLEGFADVWGINYLISAYKLEKSQAAGLVSFIFIGMLFGGPLLAFLSTRWGVYKVIILCSLGMAGLFIGMLLGTSTMNTFGLSALFFCIGILSCYQVLVFTAGSNLMPAALLGVTVAFLNCINMLGGSFFHTIIGFFMDLFWSGDMANGARVYTTQSYAYSLLTIPVCSILGGSIVYGMQKLKSSALTA